MKCPNCGKEMAAGYLQGKNLLAFNKELHKGSVNPKDPEDIMIVKNLMAGADFSGFVCRDCGLIVFDYLNPMKHY